MLPKSIESWSAVLFKRDVAGELISKPELTKSFNISD